MAPCHFSPSPADRAAAEFDEDPFGPVASTAPFDQHAVLERPPTPIPRFHTTNKRSISERPPTPTPTSRLSRASRRPSLPLSSGRPILSSPSSSASPEELRFTLAPVSNSVAMAIPLNQRSSTRSGLRSPAPSYGDVRRQMEGFPINTTPTDSLGTVPADVPPAMSPPTQSRTGLNPLPTIPEVFERVQEEDEASLNYPASISSFSEDEHKKTFRPRKPPKSHPHAAAHSFTYLRNWEREVLDELDHALTALTSFAQARHNHNPSISAKKLYSRMLVSAIDRQSVPFLFYDDTDVNVEYLDRRVERLDQQVDQLMYGNMEAMKDMISLQKSVLQMIRQLQ